jgi:predicted nucleic acid-binding protein
MRHGQAVFVDSGAWIALALSRDPLHQKAREQWDRLHAAGARLHTSVPVVIETFTFLDRNANRDAALAWRESIYRPGIVRILPCDLGDLQQSWDYFRRTDLHKLSAVGDQLCHHETRAHQDRLYLRPSLRRGGVQGGRLALGVAATPWMWQTDR